MTNDQAPMTREERAVAQIKMGNWPGMPSPRSKMFELLFPFALIFLGIAMAIVLPVIALLKQFLLD
jgi:hypothetical protein